MWLRNLGILIIVGLGIFLNTNTALASFGFSPPFVKNAHLVPGAHFEQQIIFSRAEPIGNARLEVTVDNTEVKDWISIDKGFSFILPDGQQQTPMTVLVDVPQDAALGTYKGSIRVKSIPLGDGSGGMGIAIVLGGEIRVTLTLTDEELTSFKVQVISIQTIEAGQPVKVDVKLENTGNVPVAPTRVHLDVYDEYEKLMGSGDDTEMELVKAFTTEATYAYFPMELGVSYYWGHVTVYQGEEVIGQAKIYFSVKEKGNPLLAFTKLDPKWQGVIGGIVFLIVLFLFWIKKGKMIFRAIREKRPALPFHLSIKVKKSSAKKRRRKKDM